jgi:hypothetical protein
VYGLIFFMEKTITGIVYLDMLQQFITPQLDEDDQGGRIPFGKAAHPHIILEKGVSTSALVSQVGGLVERSR